MKKRLLLTLATILMASIMFVGCGSKEESKEDGTTPATKVEQNKNEAPTKEDSKKDEPIVDIAPSYDEEFYERPDFEKEYEERLAELVADGSASAEKQAKYEYEKNILEYEAMKFVFEDMTQNFKHKKEVSATDYIKLPKRDDKETTFVCDVTKLQPEDYYNEEGDKIVYFDECFEKFVGFDVDETDATSWEDNPDIKISLTSNKIKGIEGCHAEPFYVAVVLNRNEDGTFVYKSIIFGSNAYDTIYNN